MRGSPPSRIGRIAVFTVPALWLLSSAGFAQSPPTPSTPQSVEDRLKSLENTNKALADQNRKLQEQLDSLAKKVSAPAPAPAASGSGTSSRNTGTGATGDTPDGSPPRSDRSSEGGAGARDNPAEPRPGEVKTNAVTKIPMKVGFGPGLVFESDDGEYQIQFHNQTQLESRIYQQGGMKPTAGGFYVPRERMIFQGRLTKNLEYEGSFEAAYGTINLLNAYLTYHPNDKFLLKAGRFKVPFGYEYYAISNADLMQPERSLFGTNYGLNRMPGAMTYGQLFEKRVDYAVGLFNGPRNQNVDYNNDKDVVAYLNFKPFFTEEDSPLRYLNFGGSVDAGNQNNPIVPQTLRTSVSQSANPLLALASPGWMTFNNNVTESGWRTLYSMHAAYYYKSLSLYGEWQGGVTSYAIAKNPARTNLPINGYYLSAGYFLTGETSDRRSQVKPLKPFDLRKGKFGLGAFELESRYSQLTLGNEVFTHGLADPNLWSNRAFTTDVGLNWYLNQYVKIYIDWQHAEFGQPVQFAPGKRQLTSDLFWLRAQVYF